MSYAIHRPADDSWIKEYKSSMGEDAYLVYRNKVCDLLDTLKVGESLPVEKWVKEENVPLFIKIACYYILDTRGCYEFSNDYSTIKHKYDAREMEKELALYKRKCEGQNATADGGGTESDGVRTSAISTQEPTLSGERENEPGHPITDG